MYLKKIKSIKKLCNDKGLNISFAESCTGGLLSSMFTKIPGSSEFFDSSYIVYSNKSKVNALNVPSKILKKYGAVSKETSLQMAKSLSKKTNTNIVLSITGVAGPDGATKKNPVGAVFFTIGFRNKQKMSYQTFHKKFKNTGRVSIQKKSVFFAINKILQILS